MNKMIKFVALVAMVALLAGSISSAFAAPLSGKSRMVSAKPATSNDPTMHYRFDFATTVKPFEAAADLGPSAAHLDLNTRDSACPSLQDGGSAILEGVIPAPPSDVAPQIIGTWMQTPLQATGLVAVDITFSAKSASGCAGCVPMVYVGPKLATHITDFKQGTGYLKDYWQTFTTHQVIDLKYTKSVFVAFGWAGSNASIGLDCITVDITAVSTGTAPTPTPVPSNN